MASGKYSRKKQSKRENELSYCRCVVTIFQVVVFCQNVSSIAGQGYMQSNIQADGVMQDSNALTRSELKDESNSGHIYMEPEQAATSQADVIRFEPPFLDFDAQPIGIPSMRIVYVYNPSNTKSLRLNSISARTSHFHSSFFDEKLVSPKSNTSFEVVFLARIIGNVENTLFINTAVGTFSYQVFGVGIPNPFRLRPYLGARVSLNSSFSPLISMHNPTGTPLQVVEIYTSSGYLHLQLPTGLHEANKQAWEIPPYETRPLMQASFLGQVADNHTAFIRIKTNHTDMTQYLILPMEVEVSAAPGIYSSLELLDFGTLRSQDKTKVLNLFLLNSGSKEVQITSISAQPDNPAIGIDFKPVKLKPSEALYTRVANISFNVNKVKTEEQWTGKIVVRTKEKSYAKLSITYQANVLDGTLGYDDMSTYFHIPTQNISKMVVQNITLTNTFSFPIILHKLELPDDSSNFYKIVNFSSPCTIPTQATMSCFMVECTTSAFHSLGGKIRDMVDSIHHLVLHTNASTFSLPLRAFTGLLVYKVHHSHLADLDFGIMGTLDKRHMLLAVYNHNPVKVPLLDCNSTLSGVEVDVVSLTKEGEEIEPIIRTKFDNIVMPPDSCLVFEVVLSAPKSEAMLSGSLNIFTAYEKKEIPLKARVAIGSLTVKPAKFKFRPSFPGMVVHHALSVTSSFAQTSKIESLSSSDKRFYYRKLKNMASELEPGKELKVGKVYFDARQDCKPDRCYVGLSTSTTVGHHWLMTMNVAKDAAEMDSKLYKTLRDRWKAMQQRDATVVNSEFLLSTSLVRNVQVSASASLYWPSLMEESNFEFPLTHIGKKSVSQFTLHNPSDVPVILQILPISLYFKPEIALEALEWSDLLNQDGFITNNVNTFNISVSPNSSNQDTSSQMVWLEYTLGGKTNRTYVNVFLNPGQKQKIDVTFSPAQDALVSTVILLRNNLTVLDALHVKGRGVKEQLKLGGKMSNNLNESLRFKLTESLLRDCRSDVHKESPSFTVRKSFTAKNLGLLPLHVLYVMVDNFPCEGYGFRILECESFLLQPNATRDIIIVFTPDFTSSQVIHTLRIWTSQGNILTFNLNVTLPHQMLPACQAAIPRPSWEQPIYYCITILMIVVFIGVLLAAYLEAMNIWEPFVKAYKFDNKQMSNKLLDNNSSLKRKPFNLQEIATNYNKSHVADSETKPKSSIKSTSFISSLSSVSTSGILKRIQVILNKVISFDLLHLFRGWRESGLHQRVAETAPTEEDPEPLFDNSKPVLVATSEVLRDVSNVSSTTRVRQKQSKKSKANNSWNTNNRNTNMPKLTNQTPIKIPDPIPTWTPPEPTKSDRKFIESNKKLRNNSSGSSIESSRSRGSSISSGLGETDKVKVPAKTEANRRRRKNKVLRQHSFNHDNDDSSSTTTEKSSEDYDDKPINFNNAAKWESHKNKHQLMKAMKTKKRKPFEDENEASIDLPYTTPYEQNLRRRHIKQTETISKPITHELTTSLQTKQNKAFIPNKRVPAYYDTSSTDEPVWDVPKGVNIKQDVDEVMRALAEQTQKIDGKMRVKSPQKDKERNSVCKSSSYSSVTSSSNEANNKPPALVAMQTSPTFQPKKPNLTKTWSMPDEVSTPRTTRASPVNNSATRRNSSNATNPGFSMFAAPGANDSKPHLPPPRSVTNNLPPWNNFGQNSFSITEGLMSYATTTQSSICTSPMLSSPQWGTYSPSVFSNPPVPTSNWGQSGLLNLSPVPPGVPVTPKLTPMQNGAQNWGSPSSPVSRSTHAIWSVSNAVTMDEDRNTAENDPLGLKRIWNSDTIQTDSRNDLF